MRRSMLRLLVPFIVLSGLILTILSIIGLINSLSSSHPTDAATRGFFELMLLSVGYLGVLVVIPGILVRWFWTERPLASSRAMIEQQRAQNSAIWFELKLIACLAALAILGFVASYIASRSVFTSVQEQRLGSGETAQVITAIGGLGLAIGTSIAAVIKAYALLIRARADFIRAKLSLPPAEDAATRARRQIPGSGNG